jgi:hypothetical protein
LSVAAEALEAPNAIRGTATEAPVMKDLRETVLPEDWAWR